MSIHNLYPFYLFILLFRVTPVAYVSSPARGQVEAVAAGLPTATAMWDLSCVFDLHHSSWQHQITNPLSKARDQTHILTDTSQIHFCCATMVIPSTHFLNKVLHFVVWFGEFYIF